VADRPPSGGAVGYSRDSSPNARRRGRPRRSATGRRRAGLGLAHRSATRQLASTLLDLPDLSFSIRPRSDLVRPHDPTTVSVNTRSALNDDHGEVAQVSRSASAPSDALRTKKNRDADESNRPRSKPQPRHVDGKALAAPPNQPSSTTARRETTIGICRGSPEAARALQPNMKRQAARRSSQRYHADLSNGPVARDQLPGLTSEVRRRAARTPRVPKGGAPETGHCAQRRRAGSPSSLPEPTMTCARSRQYPAKSSVPSSRLAARSNPHCRSAADLRVTQSSRVKATRSPLPSARRALPQVPSLQLDSRQCQTPQASDDRHLRGAAVQRADDSSAWRPCNAQYFPRPTSYRQVVEREHAASNEGDTQRGNQAHAIDRAALGCTDTDERSQCSKSP